MSEWTDSVAGFVLTFALHSTAWLLVAWGAAWLLRRHDGLVEAIWRVALFGALCTAAAQPWLGLSTWAPPLLAPAVVPASLPVVVDEVPVAADPAPVLSAPALTVFDWLGLGVAVYLGVVVLLLLRQVVAWFVFRRGLGRRVPVTDAATRELFAAIRLRGGVERDVVLSTSARLSGPVGFGFLRAEICLPADLLCGMGTAPLRCVLAHELAHVRDRDTWWLAAYEAIACLGFFQPLIYLARRRLRDAAEFRCDAAAVAWSGDRVRMARTLVEVAETLTAPAAGRLATPMAQRDSALVGRVRRILAESAAPTRGARRLYLGLALSMVCAGTALPGVDLSAAPPAIESTGVSVELVRLEREIADLHAGLATTWRLLAGRDLPQVSATLRAMQSRLQEMTEEHAALWRAAHELPSAPGKPVSTDSETPEKNK